jgi:hypothetical protein
MGEKSVMAFAPALVPVTFRPLAASPPFAGRFAPFGRETHFRAVLGGEDAVEYWLGVKSIDRQMRPLEVNALAVVPVALAQPPHSNVGTVRGLEAVRRPGKRIEVLRLLDIIRPVIALGVLARLNDRLADQVAQHPLGVVDSDVLAAILHVVGPECLSVRADEKHLVALLVSFDPINSPADQ